MDAIRSWATTVCLAALVAGIAGVVAPNGKFEKVYKFAVSLFLLCCMLVPLFSINNVAISGINLNDTQNSTSSSSLQETVETQTQKAVADNISQLIKQSCSGLNISPLSVSVRVVGANNKYSVQSACVVLKKADMKQKNKVIDTIKSQLGFTVNIKEGEK